MCTRVQRGSDPAVCRPRVPPPTHPAGGARALVLWCSGASPLHRYPDRLIALQGQSEFKRDCEPHVVKDKIKQKARVCGFLEFVSSSTHTPHGGGASHVRMSKRNRIGRRSLVIGRPASVRWLPRGGRTRRPPATARVRTGTAQSGRSLNGQQTTWG